MVDEERELAIVKNHCVMLTEHFDTVQIFVTRHESNAIGTVSCNFGTGNFFARFGQIQLWLEDQSIVDAEEKEGK